MRRSRGSGRRAKSADDGEGLGEIYEGAGLGLTLIGYRRTQEMLMLGRALDSTEAKDWGLVTMTGADELLAEYANGVACKLAAMPTAALARSKRLLLDFYGSNLEAQLEREAEAIALCAFEEHAGEGISAFLERRAATFA